MRVLVLNAGSSSLKFALYQASGDTPTVRVRGAVSDIGRTPRFSARSSDGTAWPEIALAVDSGQDAALDWLLDHLAQAGHGFDAVGHRVVHGGLRFAAPVRADAQTLAELEQLVPLAPLHQPHNLAAIREIARRHPELPQVACFDTAFHRSHSEVEQRYALPDALHQQGIRRYGFHGLSYQHIAAVLPQFDARAAAGKTVVLHLGNGASLCALAGGISVASSMGFSALDGIPMATRCGQIDPGVLLHLMAAHGMDGAALEELLYRRSGLLGISGLSGDMRVLLASDAPGARAAIEHFVHRIVREIGALAATLGGLDALVFTGGIGEHAAPIRAAVVERLGWLGARLDATANAANAARISRLESPIAALVIPTDEEQVIARQTLALL
jgi:acetate kinase